MKPVILIVILHYGKWAVTQECLDSLSSLKSSHYDLWTVVVNNARDTLIHSKLEQHPMVDQAVMPNENLGFAAGNNRGVSAVQKKVNYIIFLNNDTVIQSDFVVALLSVAQKQEDCILGPIIEHQVRGQTWYDYGGYIDWKKGQPRHVNKTTYLSSSELECPDFVSGCCLWISQSILDTIGGFKESYFLYLEDVELCLRARSKGYSTFLVPQAKIFHKGSQSATEWIKIRYSWRNSLKLSWQYVPWRYKLSAIGFNALFYPLLFIRWQLGHWRRKFF